MQRAGERTLRLPGSAMDQNGLAVSLSQHAYQHRSERPILLAVDQQLGEGAALRVAPELADPVGPLEVGEHQDVEQLGAGSRPEGVQAFTESAFELIGAQMRIHDLRLCRRTAARVRAPRKHWRSRLPREGLDGAVASQVLAACEVVP